VPLSYALRSPPNSAPANLPARESGKVAPDAHPSKPDYHQEPHSGCRFQRVVLGILARQDH
jgi:hypothetical protein